MSGRDGGGGGLFERESVASRAESGSMRFSHMSQTGANRTCLIGHPHWRLTGTVRIRTLASPLVFVSTPSDLTPAPPSLSEFPSSPHAAISHGSRLFGRLEICSVLRRQGRGRGYHRRSGCSLPSPPSNAAHCVGVECSRCYLNRRI